jgi:hypothetical protein
MQCLVAIIRARPLTVHFSLYNPADSNGPVYIPRLLTPLGAFVSFQVVDLVEHVVYETLLPKFKPKLDPSRAESYYPLEPGYTYGIVLETEDANDVAPGNYQLHMRYSNLQFRGTEEHPLGEMSYNAVLPLHL